MIIAPVIMIIYIRDTELRYRNVYQLIKRDRRDSFKPVIFDLVYLYEFIEHDKVVPKEPTVSNAREATRARRKAGPSRVLLTTLAFSGKRPARANLSLRIFQVQERDEGTHFHAVTRWSRDICRNKRSEYCSLRSFIFQCISFRIIYL